MSAVIPTSGSGSSSTSAYWVVVDLELPAVFALQILPLLLAS